MNKLRKGIIVFAAAIILGQVILIDYDDLNWSTNAGSYLSILSMIFIIISMLVSNQEEKQQ